MKKNIRDDFTSKDKEILAKAVNYRCSNPSCQVLTTAAKSNDNDSITNIGQAAHITAASKGGPRYDESLLKKDRSSISNGIWLCSNCASLIDREPEKYTVELLKEWKEKSCNNARFELGKKPNFLIQDKKEKIDLVIDFLELTPSIIDNENCIGFKKIDKKEIGTFICDFYKYQDPPLINCVIPFYHDMLKRWELLDMKDVVEKKQAICFYKDKINDTQSKIQSLLGFILDNNFYKYYNSFMGSNLNQNSLTDLVYAALEYFFQSDHISKNVRTKIDVWRTVSPKISAPIYLDDSEISILLENTKLEKIEYLCFGEGWKDLGDVSDSLIKNKALAAICYNIVQRDLHKSLENEEMIDLFLRYNWHIGLG